jgi:hypothetical protein
VTDEQLGDISCFRIDGINLRKFRVRGVVHQCPAELRIQVAVTYTPGRQQEFWLGIRGEYGTS